jgi:hypothetical protein
MAYVGDINTKSKGHPPCLREPLVPFDMLPFNSRDVMQEDPDEVRLQQNFSDRE